MPLANVTIIPGMGFSKSILLTLLISLLAACESSPGSPDEAADIATSVPANAPDDDQDAMMPVAVDPDTPVFQTFDASQSNTLTVEVPGTLENLPAAMKSDLTLSVIVDDQLVAMTCCDSADRWTGSITERSAPLAILELQWALEADGIKTELARLRRQTQLSAVAGISIPGSLNYDLLLDNDADGFSNLDETLSGTDPFDQFDNIAYVYPIDVLIPRIDETATPIIDGLLQSESSSDTDSLSTEWSSAVRLDRSGQRLNIDTLMIGSGNTDNQSDEHTWAAMHDGLYLYLLVLSDDHGNHYNDTNEIRKPWKDDGIELYIDGNNSKLDTYDGVDDIHMHINLFAAGVLQANSSSLDLASITRAINSAPLPADIEIATGPSSQSSTADRPDVYELRLRLSELNILPGKPFGIELQINDDDDGDTRDSKWAWYHPPVTSGIADQTWQTPNLMGTAILLD